jgi:exonuclease VII large subunit
VTPRDAADRLVKEQDEWAEDMTASRQQWIDAFDMVLDDKGEYCWREGWLQKYEELREKLRRTGQ